MPQHLSVSHLNLCHRCGSANGQTRYATTCTRQMDQPISGPSAAFARKAAGVENYVPVVLKNQNGRTATAPTSRKTDKKSSNRTKSGNNSTQSNRNDKNAKHQPQRYPNGVVNNSRMTDQMGVSSNKQQKSNNQNEPHRDRRKMTSPSRHDTTTDSSAPLLHHNGRHSNTHDISRTSVNDRLIT